MHGAFFPFQLPVACYNVTLGVLMISVGRRHFMSRIAAWHLLILLVFRGGNSWGEEPLSAGEEQSTAVPGYETPLEFDALPGMLLRQRHTQKRHIWEQHVFALVEVVMKHNRTTGN